MDFEKTIGKKFKFYGVHDTTFKIGPHLFEAVEDPDDGYRSYMRCVNKVQDEKLVFIRRSFATVEVLDLTDSDGLFEGYALVDTESGHHWLTFGTDHCDDYYPIFIFRYKTPEQKWYEDKARQVRDKSTQYNPVLGSLNHMIHKCIDEEKYDEAEDLLKKLKKEIDKQRTRH